MAYLWQTHLSRYEGEAETAYYENPRREILPYITWHPQKLLDIGCGGGATGRLLKELFPECKLYGVERDRAAASLASEFYDSIVIGDVESWDMNSCDIPVSEIDTVLLLDVLEHLYAPWNLLSRLRTSLPEHCRIVASIPNAFNIQLLDELASGTWKYTADGLLDITHIRFFTEADMRKLFEETGYFVKGMGRVPHPVSRLPEKIDVQANRVETDHVQVKGLGREEVLDLFTIQKIVIATLNPEVEYIAPKAETFSVLQRTPEQPTVQFRALGEFSEHLNSLYPEFNNYIHSWNLEGVVAGNACKVENGELAVGGWVWSKTSAPVYVSIRQKGVIRCYPLNVERPDVVQAMRNENAGGHGALLCGFCYAINTDSAFDLGFEVDGWIFWVYSGIRLG